ncbi:MAG: formyltransferase family protein [Candidatus Levybacteria bacterium]|nr:formyltransferase family protein [Candidatus Levybacteria bacterium]MDZ4228545.1 formyltransferase family protein [Candidatus Levybacteria bacterium]
MKERLATLISGGGTTMQEIIRASQSGGLPIDIACVISSSPLAGGIEKARRLGIPEKDILVIDPNDFLDANKKVDQEGFGSKLLKEMRQRGVTIITQNGWLPFTPERVIAEYKDTIFNQHPGPLPDFGGKGMYGRRVHAARLLFVRGTKRDYWTEAIAQRVRKDFDKGMIVRSARVDILPEDTVDNLQQRVLSVEHQVQIDLLKDVVRGNIREQVGATLIRSGEEKILFEAKKAGILLYPHG